MLQINKEQEITANSRASKWMAMVGVIYGEKWYKETFVRLPCLFPLMAILFILFPRSITLELHLMLSSLLGIIFIGH